MVKKIAAIAGAGALLLSMAAPALGHWYFPSRDINNADVINVSTATALTGGNTQNNSASVRQAMGVGAWAGSSGARDIDTGNAAADANALVVVNSRPACTLCGQNRPVTNNAMVYNDAMAVAGTGDNHQNDSASVQQAYRSGARAGSSGDRDLDTGNANAVSNAVSVVNSLWSWVP